MGWGSGGCVRRIEVVKKQKKSRGCPVRGRGRQGGGRGGFGVCEPRIDVIVKLKKKSGVGSGGDLVGIGGYEPRIGIIVKLLNKSWGSGRVRGVGLGLGLVCTLN